MKTKRSDRSDRNESEVERRELIVELGEEIEAAMAYALSQLVVDYLVMKWVMMFSIYQHFPF